MLKMLPSCMNALQKPFTHWSSSPKTAEISQRIFLSSSACILAMVSCSFKAELPLSLKAGIITILWSYTLSLSFKNGVPLLFCQHS